MYPPKSYLSLAFSLFFCTTLIIQEGFLFLFNPESTVFSRFNRFRSSQDSIDTGFLFYTKDALDMLHIDDVFLLELISKHTDRTLPQNLEMKYENDPFKRILLSHKDISNLTFHHLSENSPSVLKKNTTYLITPSVDAFLRDPWDDIVLRSLYCNFGVYDEKDFQSLKSLQDYSGGYFDTHFLLGILLLEEENCFNREILKKEKETVVRRIITTEKNDTVFSDLYVERIVFLYWAGFGDTVQKKWIDIIKKNLASDPGWRTNNETFSNAHTTGLALLSLIYFQEGRTTQDFYSLK